MTIISKYKDTFCGHRILLIMILCLFGLWQTQSLWAQKVTEKKGDKFYIDHADNLRHNQMEMPDVQIAKGNVRFRYKGMTLRCDSAYLMRKINGSKRLAWYT